MYSMYKMIKKQPAALQYTLDNSGKDAGRAFELIKNKRVYLTGCGSSFHAAIYGEFILRSFGLDAQAVHALDMIHYPPSLTNSAVIIISHSWKTRTTLKALDALISKKIPSIGITANDNASKDVNVLLRTTDYYDESDCVTMGYTTKLAALALIAESSRSERIITKIPSLVEKSFMIEEEVRKLAQKYSKRKRFFVLGSGPNTATALEAALKMKEGNFTDTEGMQLEQMLHGSISGVDDEDVVFLVAPKSGKTRQRIYETVQAMTKIGATTIAVTDGTTEISKEATHTLRIEFQPEYLNPILSIIPLQFFAYFLAENNGINPDLTREDDQRYRKAYSTLFLHLK